MVHTSSRPRPNHIWRTNEFNVHVCRKHLAWAAWQYENPWHTTWRRPCSETHAGALVYCFQNIYNEDLIKQRQLEDLKWRSAGPSGTGTSGQADTAEEVGLDQTHPKESSTTHQALTWNPQGKREAGLATVGGETLKQSWNSKGPTSPEWPEQPRTECDGEGSLMA